MTEKGALLSPCCGVPAVFNVLLSVQLPQSAFRRVTKKILASASARIEAAHWDRVIWSCPQCSAVWGVPGFNPGTVLGET